MNAYPVLSDRCLERVAAMRVASSEVVRPKGSVLFAEGQEALGVYVLWEGRVKLTIGSDNGKSLILGVVGPGTALGLPAAILGLPYAAAAQVVQAAKVTFLGRDDLLRHMHASEGASYEAAEMVSALYYSVLAEIKTVHLCQSSEQKLARFFLGLRPMSRSPKGEGQLTLDASQEEIGQMIGVSRETVARVIARFRKRRILEFKNRTLTIYDQAALERFAKLRGMQEDAG